MEDPRIVERRCRCDDGKTGSVRGYARYAGRNGEDEISRDNMADI